MTVSDYSQGWIARMLLSVTMKGSLKGWLLPIHRERGKGEILLEKQNTQFNSQVGICDL